MNKYIPTERDDNKPCQNKECSRYNAGCIMNCSYFTKAFIHNCKGYQPEQEELPNQNTTDTNEIDYDDFQPLPNQPKQEENLCNTCRWFCPIECPPVDCDNYSAWMPREEAPIIPTGVCPECGHPDSARCNEDYPGFTECEECGYIPEQEEKPASVEWERIPFLSSRPIVIDDDLGRMQKAVNNNADGIQLALDEIKALNQWRDVDGTHIRAFKKQTEYDIKRLEHRIKQLED